MSYSDMWPDELPYERINLDLDEDETDEEDDE